MFFRPLRRAEEGGRTLGSRRLSLPAGAVLRRSSHPQAQRLLLEVLGLLLSRVQGKTPSRGVIYHGSEGTPTMVRFSADLKAAEILLSEILRMQQGDVAPKLLLNDHCPICEFRPKCRAQAMKEDHLSLLRGLGEKEI